MTTVLNLATGEHLIYSCTPVQAVVCACRQSRRDWSWWSYDWSVEIGPSGRTVFCGDFGALLGGG